MILFMSFINPMKRKLLIWSFWNADIYYKNQLLEYSDCWEFSWLNFFERTEKILNDFDKYRDEISFNMLDRFIDQSWNDFVYDFIWIYTKQVSKYAKNDTHLLYPIIKKYVEYKKYVWIDFAFYDETYQIILDDSFDQERIYTILVMELQKIKEEIDIVWFDEVDVNITWWTKIMAILLTHVARNVFKNTNMHIYYGLWDKDTNSTNFIIIDNFLKDL